MVFLAIIAIIILIFGILLFTEDKLSNIAIGFFVSLIAILILNFCVDAFVPRDLYEETVFLKPLEKENFYKVEIKYHRLSEVRKITVCIVDDDEISHIQEIECNVLKIEYSSEATKGKMTVKYDLSNSKDGNIPYKVEEIVLRIPEAYKP